MLQHLRLGTTRTMKGGEMRTRARLLGDGRQARESRLTAKTTSYTITYNLCKEYRSRRGGMRKVILVPCCFVRSYVVQRKVRARKPPNVEKEVFLVPSVVVRGIRYATS